MSAKSSRFDTRTMIIIFIVVLIAIAVIYSVLNAPEEEEKYSPDEIRLNQDQHIGKTRIVEGYYDSNLNSIISTTSSLDPGLRINTSNLPDEVLPLRENVKYEFKGVVVEERTDVGSFVILVAESVVEV